MRIKKLPDYLINQIAAGEVIERPASVLKELLENSLDAKSKKIIIKITSGGLSQIKIIDDGIGIEKEDLKLACTQHATSKLENLDSISFLGFRGEALASIGSVAKLEITSRPKSQQHAWCLKLQDNTLQPESNPIGTTIVVNDLFYNIPVRRKFLRSERTEYFHLEEIFKRIALSRFEIGFELWHNDKRIFNLSIATTKSERLRRIDHLFGSNFRRNAIDLESKEDKMHCSGWITEPSSAKTQAMHQYFYVNNRIIKDRLINHAIKQAYQNIAGPGKNPNYCLYLELPLSDLDVNVHPTKYEVRFLHARMVHNFIIGLISSISAPVEEAPHVPEYKQAPMEFKPKVRKESYIKPVIASKPVEVKKQVVKQKDIQVLGLIGKVAMVKIDGRFAIVLGQKLFEMVVLPKLQSKIESQDLIQPMVGKTKHKLDVQALAKLGVMVEPTLDDKYIVRSIPKAIGLDFDLEPWIDKLIQTPKLENLLPEVKLTEFKVKHWLLVLLENNHELNGVCEYLQEKELVDLIS